MTDQDSDSANPLRARFTGRRPWLRVPCTHRIRLRGAGESLYDGETVDLSRAGVLVTVTDHAFRAGEEEDGVSLIQRRFPDGVAITFTDAGITRWASIIRATLHRDEQLALGCAFEQELTVGEALALGLVAGESGVPEAGAASLPYVPRPGVAMSLVLLGATESVVGPLALGSVLAVGGQAIEATFGKPVDAMVASCRGDSFNILLVVGRERIWSGRGTLVGCWPHEAGCRVRVLAAEALGRSVGRRVQLADPGA